MGSPAHNSSGSYYPQQLSLHRGSIFGELETTSISAANLSEVSLALVNTNTESENDLAMSDSDDILS